MSRGVLLTPATRGWECLAADCDVTDVTPAAVTSRMHTCRHAGLGLDVPLYPAGTRGEARVVRPEGYVGGVGHQNDLEGRPVAALELWRDDGQDCVVYLNTNPIGVQR